MVGFVFGVLATLTWRSDRPDRDRPVPAAQAPADTPPATPTPNPATDVNALRIEDQPSLTVVEMLFEQYRGYVFWEDDRTEIGVWNTRTLSFSDKFEVLRTDTGTYFRSIHAFTRIPLEKYGPSDSPLLFTETETQRAARYLQSRGQIRRSIPPPTPPAADLPKAQPKPNERR
jgi:hypothetical protein